MSYSPEEVDKLVGNLEKRIEKLQATMNSAVKRTASERDLLAAAEEIRDLLKKAVGDDKAHLNLVFGGDCERIGRIRYGLDAVEFSDMHKKDVRWKDLNEACTVIEEVLKGLGVYKPWKPIPKGVKKIEYKQRRKLGINRQVVMKPEIEAAEGVELTFSVEPALPEGLVLDTTTGVISGQPIAETPETTYVVTAKNDKTTASFDVVLGVSHAAPKGLVYPPYQLSDKLVVDLSVDIRPEIGGGPGTFTVEPALPAGLELDPETGYITGAPISPCDFAEYVVTSANTAGQCSVTVGFSVQHAPPTVAYPSLGHMYHVGVEMKVEPEISGVVTEFSVEPSLPAALELDSATGIVAGVPQEVVAQSSWVVTARNTGGESSTSLTFKVTVPPPSEFSYPDVAEKYQIGDSVELNPKVTGDVEKYSPDPKLPGGLALDRATGVLSGVLTEVTNGEWTITAKNDGGETSTVLNLNILNVPPPSELSYPDVAEKYEVGDSVELSPKVTGDVKTYSADPNVPGGLALDPATGVLSGVLTEVTSGEWTITAKNDGGETSTVLNLSIAAPPPPPSELRYDVDDIGARGGRLIVGQDVSLPAVLGCGEADSFSVDPELPEGLALDTSTGVISGAPAELAEEKTWTITAKNRKGETTAPLTFSIVIPPPTNLEYPSLTSTYGVGHEVDFAPRFDGTADEFQIEPSLPEGLTIDESTGIIRGTPVSCKDKADYTVTAKNSSGTATTTLAFDVAVLPPASLEYPSLVPKYGVNHDVELSPTYVGPVDEFKVEPSLPEGLTIDECTGVIRGRPTATSKSLLYGLPSYTVTATNSGGSASTTLLFEIGILAPLNLKYPSLESTYGVDRYVEVPPVFDGTADEFKIFPSPPAGLGIDTFTGIISGRAAAASPKAEYTVTATNSEGETSTALVFEVVVFAPENLQYPSLKPTYGVLMEVEDLAPTFVGPVDMFVVEPSLPEGLAFDGSSGMIRGKPSKVTDKAEYLVTAKNVGGTATTTLEFEVAVLAPANLEYPLLTSQYGVTQSVEVAPRFDGPVDEFEVKPSLPEGLFFDSSSGVIRGKPTAVADMAEYAVTAKNSAGDCTAKVSFEVGVFPPASVSYPSLDPTYTVGETVDVSPEIEGYATAFEVQPELPPGLSLDPASGVISGTPSKDVDEAMYTITASNEAGATKTEVSFSIEVAAPSSVSYPDASREYTVGEDVFTEPLFDGGKASWSVSPTLPDGLGLDPKTGVISGKPTAPSDEADYTITVKNASGSCKAVLTVQVVEPIEDVTGTITAGFAERIEAIEDVADLMEEPSKKLQYGDWMIWMVHRAHLNDPDLDDFSFNNMPMPPGYVEARISPKLMAAMATNTHIKRLSLVNSNMQRTEGHTLCESLKQNKVLKSLDLTANFLDSDAVQHLGQALRENKENGIEILRVSHQQQMGESFGRPVEEAFGAMMEANWTILKLGFPCHDPHWRNTIDRALLRNNDRARRMRKSARASPEELEEEMPIEEKALGLNVKLDKPPETPSDEWFKDGTGADAVIRAYISQNLKLPIAKQLQAFGSSRSTPVKYSEAQPTVLKCREKMLQAAVGTEVTVTDPFEVEFTGQLKRWEVQNENWTLEIISSGKRYLFKGARDPLLSVTAQWGAWFKSE